MKKLPFTQEESENPVYGKLAKLLMPSGATITIREQNGEDDDTVSSFLSGNDMIGPINRFIASLIIKNDYNFTTSKDGMSDKEVLDMPLKDKYFVLISSRIFSISETIKFEWDWRNEKPPVAYEEDLLSYLWDYNKPFPEMGDPDYYKYKIPPYPRGLRSRELTLSTGKMIRYRFMDGHGESYVMGLPDAQKTMNTMIKSRFLEIKTELDQWTIVESFKPFKTYEMAEIRDDINTHDQPFDGFTELLNPYNNESIEVPLLSIPDFFFPREI